MARRWDLESVRNISRTMNVPDPEGAPAFGQGSFGAVRHRFANGFTTPIHATHPSGGRLARNEPTAARSSCWALPLCTAVAAAWAAMFAVPAGATPANKAALGTHFGALLSARLDACTTCHVALPGAKGPATLDDLPHNAFGARLKAVAATLRKTGKRVDIGRRLDAIAKEDTDGDGIDNETELLLGRAPGDAKDKPTATELKTAAAVRARFQAFRSVYRWQPFEPVAAPPVPKSPPSLAGTRLRVWGQGGVRRNPIDAFLAADRAKKGLATRPSADKRTLLRRVTLDLTGLAPTVAEMEAFLADARPDAYERAVDRLLASPRYGERWGRHFMDVWRYSDWAGWNDGGQIRDSQPHIWRWRDWIVESLNDDKGYDRMVQEMVAGDELAPGDESALRATGFLARNFKLLSREQWLEDTVNHTSRALLGVTLHCAKCHTHMYDPVSQSDYYKFRAIFEPHNVRLDRVPGEADTSRNGLTRVFDADPTAATYFFVRGDERNPDKNRPEAPGVPESLGGRLDIRPVNLPLSAFRPDRRDFVVRESVAASEKTLLAAWTGGDALAIAAAEAGHKALLATLAAEKLEDDGKKGSAEWTALAKLATASQRDARVAQARAALATAKDKASAQKALDDALAAQKLPASVEYTPRGKTYPAASTGRRLALARWLTERQNPLTARVAVNHVWMRHFGQALVPSVADFGRNGRKPTHPELLDWLSAQFMENGWKMKPLHRMIVTSAAYRLDSKTDPALAAKDPDNLYVWRMSPRRLEAEAVRDNVLFAAGHLDEARGGPEIDHNLGLTSTRRSIYLRHAAEKQVEMLQIFDGPSVTECYERKPSVMPQQALALANSSLALREARALASILAKGLATPENAPGFVRAAFLRLLSRPPSVSEMRLCLQFLAERPGDPLQRRYDNLVLSLFNHNDFVTVR